MEWSKKESRRGKQYVEVTRKSTLIWLGHIVRREDVLFLLKHSQPLWSALSSFFTIVMSLPLPPPSIPPVSPCPPFLPYCCSCFQFSSCSSSSLSPYPPSLPYCCSSSLLFYSSLSPSPSSLPYWPEWETVTFFRLTPSSTTPTSRHPASATCRQGEIHSQSRVIRVLLHALDTGDTYECRYNRLYEFTFSVEVEPYCTKKRWRVLFVFFLSGFTSYSLSSVRSSSPLLIHFSFFCFLCFCLFIHLFCSLTHPGVKMDQSAACEELLVRCWFSISYIPLAHSFVYLFIHSFIRSTIHSVIHLSILSVFLFVFPSFALHNTVWVIFLLEPFLSASEGNSRWGCL